jgi:NADH-quinone oxidoreductase subunit L
MTVMIPSYYVWMIFILPFVGSVITPLLSKAPKARDYVAVLFSFLSAAFALFLLLPVIQGQTVSLVDSIIPSSLPWIPELGIRVGILSDPYTIILTNVVAWISFLIMVYSVDYMKGESGLNRYWFFMNFFIGNMQLIVLSDNFLSLYFGWEGVGLCSYGLIGYFFTDEKHNWVGTPGSKALGEEQAYSPSHAGMKAFVMTRVGDIAMLAGILILFIYSGTFSYQVLAKSNSWATSLAQAGLLVPVAILIFGGAVGKSAQFPLHEWLPDAMAGPAPVSALIHAATMVKAGVVLVARIGPLFYFAFANNPALVQPFFLTVAWIGAFTAFLAASQALVGFELKKILAYSTVSQVGYMMMALGLTGLSSYFTQGLSAGLYHLMSHAIFKAALFMAAGVLIHVTGSKYVSDMGGLKDKMRLTFIAFFIAAASLSGLPPFSGFWSKDAVLATAWDSGQIGLFLVGALTAGLTAFYSFRMFGIIFFGGPSKHLEEHETEGHHVHEVGPLGWVPYVTLAAGTLAIGILAPIVNLDGALQSATRAYLLSLYPSLTTIQTEASAGFDIFSSLIALGFVALGVLAAWTIYESRRVSAERFVGQSGFMRGLYKFLENRWYINAIYYKVFVNAPISISRWLLSYIEIRGLESVNAGGAALGLYLSAAGNWLDTKVIDGVANGISSVGQSFSRSARRIQTGVTEQYAFAVALGLLILVVVFIIASGVYKLL